jgi:hypothetical protein
LLRRAEQHPGHGPKPTSIDAGIYGFIANIYFFEIDTPLKQFVVAHANIVRHCRAIHDAVMEKRRSPDGLSGLQEIAIIDDDPTAFRDP